MKETLKNRKLWRAILCVALLGIAVILVVSKCQSKNDVIYKATINDLPSIDSAPDSMPDAFTRDFRQYETTPELLDLLTPHEDDTHTAEYVVENGSPEPPIWEFCSTLTDKLTANLPLIAQLWIIAIVYIILVVLLLRILSWGCIWIIDTFNHSRPCQLKKEKERYSELLALLEDNYAKTKETNRELDELLEKAKSVIGDSIDFKDDVAFNNKYDRDLKVPLLDEEKLKQLDEEFNDELPQPTF